MLSVISTSLKCGSGVCETAVLAAAGWGGSWICFLASAVVLELNQSPVCVFGFGGGGMKEWWELTADGAANHPEGKPQCGRFGIFLVW